MESTGKAGEIHCTDRFKQVLEKKHHFVSRGQIEIKGKGMMETWLLMD
jgi:Adenylate and Guanylate cyclase catalytic domain